MDVVFVQMLAFLAALLFAVGIEQVLRGRSASRPATGKPLLFRWMDPYASQVGWAADVPFASAFPRQYGEIQNRLMAAALYERLSAAEVIGAQITLGLATFLLFAVLVFAFSLRLDYALIAGVGLGFLGVIYPGLWVGRAARSRQEAIARALPYSIDLLSVAMQAGQDFGAAVRFLVSEGVQGPLADEFGVMMRETELGKPRSDALKNMASRIQLDEARSLVTAVIQSSEMGASVAETLKVQAEELRRTRFHRAERKAARATSLMIIPVALFILPAVFIVILAPVMIKMAATRAAMR